MVVAEVVILAVDADLATRKTNHHTRPYVCGRVFFFSNLPRKQDTGGTQLFLFRENRIS